MLAQSVNHVTLDKAPRPTKSEWDSADAKANKHIWMLALRKASGIEVLSISIPTVLTAKSIAILETVR